MTAELVVEWLAGQGVEAYLVGGCVRDRLLGRPLYDLDVAVDGDGLGLARRLANQFGGAYYPLDEVRGTGRAILTTGSGHRLIIDVARFRGPDLAADLADRDFTINALAANARAVDEVIDLHGGLADLQARRIRPVDDASIRNDPLRALRAVRLAAELDFELAPEAELLIRRDGAALARVSGERVRDELARLLVLPYSATYVRRLDDLGLLTVVLPELEPLRGLLQPPPHHLDALAHSLQAVDALEVLLTDLEERRRGMADGSRGAAPDVEVLLPLADRLLAHLGLAMSDGRPRLVLLKLAALLHDVGKPLTASVAADGRIRFFSHDRQGAALAADTLRRLRFSQAETRLVQAIVRHHMRPLLLAEEGEVSRRAVYRFFREAQEAGVEVLLLALADHRATCASDAADGSPRALVALAGRMLTDYWELQAERLSPPPLIDGDDVRREFGLAPGPRIGELLEAVREAQAAGEVATREEALALIGALLKDRGC